MRAPLRTAAFGLLLWAGLARPSSAIIPFPAATNFQGVAKDATGHLINGSVTLSLNYYDAASAGALLYSEKFNATAANGLFNVALGNGVAVAGGSETSYQNVAQNHNAVYVQVTVNSDPAMTPRFPLLAAPYALRASTVDSFGGATAGFYLNTGSAAQAKTGPLSLSATLAGPVLSVTQGNNEAAATIQATTSSEAGSAVLGVNNDGGGGGTGVYGEAHGSGVGVYGTSPAGKGVEGFSSGNIGVEGRSNSEEGVYGVSGTGTGVRGESSSSSSTSAGVIGTGNVNGVKGTTSAVAGVGVHGAATNATGGIGVLAESAGGYALHAMTTGGTSAAIYVQSVGGDGILATTQTAGSFAVHAGSTNGTGGGVSGFSSQETGVVGGTSSGVGVEATTRNGTTALQVDNGSIKVSGVVRPAFVVTANTASGGNATGNTLRLDNALTNGDPNAILIVTPNFNPGGAGGVYNNHPIGVYYITGLKEWAIFNQDTAAIPNSTSFNVLVIKQ